MWNRVPPKSTELLGIIGTKFLCLPRVPFRWTVTGHLVWENLEMSGYSTAQGTDLELENFMENLVGETV